MSYCGPVKVSVPETTPRNIAAEFNTGSPRERFLWCPKSATARFGCKQRKAGNDTGAALGGAAQRATAGRQIARSEQSSCTCPTCVLVDSQTDPFEGRGKTKRPSDSVDDIGGDIERPGILDESRLRYEISLPLTKLQHLKKSTPPRVARCGFYPDFFQCAPVGGGGAHRACAFSMPTHAPHIKTCLLQGACVPVFL